MNEQAISGIAVTVGALGLCLLGVGITQASALLIGLGIGFLVLAFLIFGSRLFRHPDPAPADGVVVGDSAENPWSGQRNVFEEWPQIALPVYASSKEEMTQLSPYNWALPPGQDRPELMLRAAIALPAVSATMYAPPQIATKIQGEPREDLILRVLATAELTQWLRGLCDTWNCSPDAAWEVQGVSDIEQTDLFFCPHSVASEQPLMARCNFKTGWRNVAGNELVPAIRLTVGLIVNLTQLDAQRQLADEPWPPGLDPAPAALSLDELAEYQIRLVSALRLAQTMGASLIPDGDLTVGYLGAWISPSRRMFQQLVNVSGITRLPGSNGPGTAAKVGDWPLAGTSSPRAIGSFVADGLDDLLRRAGYRGIGERFAYLRSLDELPRGS